MKRVLSSIFAAALVLGLTPSLAGALGEGDFDIENTRELLRLCGASPSMNLSEQAVYFCHGYFTGAADYHDSVVGGDLKRLICDPEGTTRNDAVNVFVSWGNANLANEARMGEPALLGVIRALAEKWPCS